MKSVDQLIPELGKTVFYQAFNSELILPAHLSLIDGLNYIEREKSSVIENLRAYVRHNALVWYPSASSKRKEPYYKENPEILSIDVRSGLSLWDTVNSHRVSFSVWIYFR